MQNTTEILRNAFDEHSRWKLSLWDALILSAARAGGATILLTEDFSTGHDYNGVTALNPLQDGFSLD